MSRFLRILAAAVLLGGVSSVASLASPSDAFACMCAEMPAIDTFDGDGEAVIVGRVGRDDGSGRFPFAVEAWFHGGEAPAVVLQSAMTRDPNGVSSWNSCGIELSTGDHLVLGASGGGGSLVPNTCTPLAHVDSPGGQAMLQAAARKFGPGRPPGAPPAAPPVADSDGAPVDLGLVGIASVGLLVAVVIAVTALAFRRRDVPEAPAP
jgi:hypothetical protein